MVEGGSEREKKNACKKGKAFPKQHVKLTQKQSRGCLLTGCLSSTSADDFVLDDVPHFTFQGPSRCSPPSHPL